MTPDTVSSSAHNPSMTAMFNISNRSLTTLQDVVFPDGVETVDCSNNLLTSLVGLPPTVKSLLCSYNQLRTLEGCPASVVTLVCANNPLTSLAGLPPTLTELYSWNTQLTSLRRLPYTVELLICKDNPLDEEWRNKSLDNVHALNQQKDLAQARRHHMAAYRIQLYWRRYWCVPNKEGEARCAKRSYERDVVPNLALDVFHP